MGINAVYLGAKSVNPDIKIKVIWVSTWFDPGKEADAAKALRDQGADILFQHTDSPAAMKMAEQEGIYAVGQASDMHTYGPKAQLTAIVNNWGPYYVKRVQAVMDGTWETGDVWGGFDSGMLQMADWHNSVPADVAAEADTARAAIAAGTFHPFTGPLKKQDGSAFLAAGEVVKDGDLAGMNFYVEGITGNLP